MPEAAELKRGSGGPRFEFVAAAAGLNGVPDDGKPGRSASPQENLRHLISDLRLIAAPRPKEALDLLLYPDGVELNGYYLRLASSLYRARITTRDIPEPLLKILCELLASAGNITRGPDAHELFIRLLFKIPPGLLAWLFEKRFPLHPFIDNIDSRRIFPGTMPASQVLRKMWRLLRRRLISGSSEACSPAHGLETTLSDLRFLSNASRRPGRVKSAWRIHGKAVASRLATAQRDGPAQTMRHLYWGGARSRKIAFWEKLIRTQAEELSEIRRLAREVGSRTGRVVLSWHNASLGAAGGWAFEGISAQFDSPALYSLFVRAALEEAAQIRKSFDVSSAMGLCAMRSERLFAPGMARAVGEKYEWPGALSPHQRTSPEQGSAWIEKAHKTWADGLILLIALANQGQRMLDSGKIHSLVLPWIDKFFISSRRLADLTYLERLFRFVSANIRQPLILFWDDTPHCKAPSLGLALEYLVGRGLPVRAIGIFDTGASAGGLHGDERAEAMRIILEDYRQKTLFALRPLNENHCPEAFRWIFKDLDMKFFLNYDSSWKDNLAFIYTGTQVFPLLSVQTEMESVSPWVFGGGDRYAFGAWFRRTLRHISLGKLEGISDPLRLKYCSWANLL